MNGRVLRFQGYDGEKWVPVVRLLFDADLCVWWSPVFDQSRMFCVNQRYPIREFTNTLDAKGLSLFEEDIVYWQSTGVNDYGEHTEQTGIVRWNDQEKGFKVLDLDLKHWRHLDSSWTRIGNTVDNPELLKERK